MAADIERRWKLRSDINGITWWTSHGSPSMVTLHKKRVGWFAYDGIQFGDIFVWQHTLAAATTGGGGGGNNVGPVWVHGRGTGRCGLRF